MSALPPKADISSALCDVRFVPKADIALAEACARLLRSLRSQSESCRTRGLTSHESRPKLVAPSPRSGACRTPGGKYVSKTGARITDLQAAAASKSKTKATVPASRRVRGERLPGHAQPRRRRRKATGKRAEKIRPEAPTLLPERCQSFRQQQWRRPRG
jgi:hypothetical protein